MIYNSTPVVWQHFMHSRCVYGADKINMYLILGKLTVYLQRELQSKSLPATERFQGKQLGAASFNLLQHMYNPCLFFQPDIWGCKEPQSGYTKNYNQQFQANRQQYGNYYYPQSCLFNQQQPQHHVLTPYNFSYLPNRPNLDSANDTAIPNVFASTSSKEAAHRHDYTTSNGYQLSYRLKQHNQPQDIVGTTRFFHI